MTGRIRTLKPEWLDDELLASASDAARVLSAGLILLADDYGNGRASIATIAASVWRYELERDDGANAPEVLAKASRAFQELLAMGFVGVWVESGQRYFAIRNWARHQRVDKPGKPQVPKPPANLFRIEKAPPIENSRGAPELVASVSIPIRESLAPDLDQRPGPVQDLESTRILARAQEPEPAPAAPKQIGGNPAEISGNRGGSESPPARKPTKPEQDPKNLAEALELPICSRAEFVIGRPDRAEWVQPHKWPEVVRVAEVLHQVGGLGDVRLGTYQRDTGVRAVVELFAMGYMPSDLQRACRTVVGQPWWTKDGAKRGLSSLTPAVVRAALASGLTPAQESRIARALGGTATAPSRLAALLPPIPAAAGDT